MSMTKILDGSYSITNAGNLYSHKSNKFIKQNRNHAGYMLAGVSLAGKAKTVVIARLVAQAFVPNPNNLPQVNHIDGRKDNNHYTNLEWCTAKENIAHAYKTGLSKPLTSMNTHTRKLTPEDITKIRKLYSDGLTQLAIAKLYAITQSNVSRIVNINRWRTI